MVQIDASDGLTERAELVEDGVEGATLHLLQQDVESAIGPVRNSTYVSNDVGVLELGEDLDLADQVVQILTSFGLLDPFGDDSFHGDDLTRAHQHAHIYTSAGPSTDELTNLIIGFHDLHCLFFLEI